MPEVDVFQALANPVRREILMRLRQEPRPVTRLSRELGPLFRIGRPALSEHLQVLRKANLVREEPRGRERYYHLDPRPFAEVEAWVNAFTHYWDGRLQALGVLLESASALPAAIPGPPPSSHPQPPELSP